MWRGRILSFAFIKDLNPTYANATAIGFLNSIIMFSGIVFQPLSGVILESTRYEVISTSGNTLSYNYQIAFIIIPVGLLLSWVLLKVISRKEQATYLGSVASVGADLKVPKIANLDKATSLTHKSFEK